MVSLQIIASEHERLSLFLLVSCLLAGELILLSLSRSMPEILVNCIWAFSVVVVVVVVFL